MYDLFCHHCDRHYLVGSDAIISAHETSEGFVAYTKCPAGHRLARYFRIGDAVDLPAPADIAA